MVDNSIATIQPGSHPASNEATIGRDSALALFLVALCFRMIYIIQSADNPLFGVAVIDAQVYEGWAGRMGEGIWLRDTVGNYLPIYPAFLALQKALFGAGPLANKLVQSVMGSLAAVFMAQTAALAWNRRVGLLCGYLVAANWLLVVFEAEKYAESFSIFFLSLTFWLLLKPSNRFWTVTASGFTFALSAGARANLFLLLPFILWWLLRSSRSSYKSAILKATLFCLGTIVIIGPIVHRNYQVSGVPMLRAQATWSLYSGLAPEFKGLHPPVGILFDKYMHLPLQEGLRTEKDIERFWGQKVLEIIREDPAGVIYNLLRRVTIFFNGREWSQEFDVYAYRAYSTFLSLPWVGFCLIGPLGCLGLLLLRRPSNEQWLIAGGAILSFLSIIFFKASDRYRMPTAVLLSAFAAAAVWQVWQQWQCGNRRFVVRAWMLFIGLGLIFWPDWPGLEKRQTARHDFHVGVHSVSVARLDDALKHFKASMDAFPWDPDSPYHIGRILIHRGQRESGLEYIHEALRREPHFPKAINEIALHHLSQDDLYAAEDKALESLRLNPTEKNTLLLLAELYRRQGRRVKERAFLDRAVVESNDSTVYAYVADRLVDLGEHRQAVRIYDRVVSDRGADPHLRVKAALAAGITAVRFFDDKKVGQKFFSIIVKDFKEFSFFSIQAEFLQGVISAAELKIKMARGAEWQAAAAYVAGLSCELRGDLEKATAAYRECLDTIKTEKSVRPNGLPYKWAWDDLRRIQGQRHPAAEEDISKRQ